MNFDIRRLLLSLSPTKWLIFANKGLKHHDVKFFVPKSNFHIHPSLHPSIRPSIHLPRSACGLCLHLPELLRVSIFHINPTYIFLFLITVFAVKWPVVMMFAYCLFFFQWFIISHSNGVGQESKWMLIIFRSRVFRTIVSSGPSAPPNVADPEERSHLLLMLAWQNVSWGDSSDWLLEQHIERKERRQRWKPSYRMPPFCRLHL